MRAVVQRVLEAKVQHQDNLKAKIAEGLLVFISVAKTDTVENARFLAEKLVNLRLFPDQAGKMNLSIKDTAGQILIVSNFTLHGDCSKGRRPGFDLAAEPEKAEELYEKLISFVAEQGVDVQKGVFGGYMHISCVNDGPVTFIIDNK